MAQSYNSEQSCIIQHVVVRNETGRFFGWPANGGIWSWGDEILVQYKHGEFQDKPVGSHDINYNKPITVDQSRSLDGGLTWTHYPTPIYSTEDGVSPTNATALTTPIDFSDSNTILKFEWSGNLYYSTDRGVNWSGPFILPKFDMVSLQLRTDYIIEDKNTCLAFWSMSKENFKRAENGDMVYMVKTTDGGITWAKEAHISRQVNPSDNKHDIAIMPSTVRISPTKLVTCIRNLTAYPKVSWIECRISTDNGKSWTLQSTPVGDEAGTTPPALSRLSDGRLVLTYGYRKPIAGPTSIRAKISSDEGRTWCDEIILRTGGGDEDIGYTRNVVRPDGKLVTIYYWQEDEKAERYIAATIWTLPETTRVSSSEKSTTVSEPVPDRRTWSKEPVVPIKIASHCEPVAYSGQRLDPKSLLGRRVDINLNSGLLNAVDLDDYLRGYRETPKWPSGEYLGKFMQGYSRMYLYTGDPVILERLSKIVETWLKVQDEDGWIGTGKRWGAWDVWEHKYVLLGLIDYYALTGDQSALNAAKKIGDLMCANFGSGKRDIMQTGSWAMGSGSILEPMTYLYRYTGDEKYLQFCEYILQAFEDETGPKIIKILTTGSKSVYDITDPWSKRPIRPTRNRTKGYEMLAALIGILRMYELTGRSEYLIAAENCWRDIVDKRLYITGTSTSDESFREDHVLPGEPADQVGEGCVTAHWIFFNRLLFYLTGEPRYADEIEKSLYNHLLASQGPHDCYQAYFAPLNGSKQFQRHNVWEGKPPCCVSSVMRCIARTLEVIWTKFTDGGLAILIYNKGCMKDQIQTSNGLLPVALEIDSDYPETGNLTIKVQPEQTATFRIALRVPVWSRKFEAQVGDRKYKGFSGQFLDINKKWRSGDTIKITMDMNDRLIEGGPSYAGHFAFQHGPQVLTLVSKKNASDELESARVKPVNGLQLEAVSGTLPDGWIGDQAYRSPALKAEASVLLVPFADAGQLNYMSKYRTWIKAEHE